MSCAVSLSYPQPHRAGSMAVDSQSVCILAELVHDLSIYIPGNAHFICGTLVASTEFLIELELPERSTALTLRAADAADATASIK